MKLPPMRMNNVVQHYDWGSREAIPRLLGQPGDGTPWAELWMGGHPRAPSSVHPEGSDVSRALDGLARDHPEALLGKRSVARFGEEWPFLFKVLAAQRPLSIQCHPDAAQAAAGFAREQAAGVSVDDKCRTFRDDRHKPELLVALEPFEALLGFRTRDDVRTQIARAGVMGLEGPLHALESGDDTEGIRAFFSALLQLGPGERQRALGAARDGAADGDAVHRWLQELVDGHPHDVMALAPLFMNVLELAPGEAVFLGPGVLHAYLRGTGLELMANSDNVLRAGLTSKHVDAEQLLDIGRFAPSRPAVLASPLRTAARHRYPTTAPEFSLWRCVAGGDERIPGAGAVAVALCTEGTVEVVADGHRVPLPVGASAVVPASCTAARLDGAGVAFVAVVPDAGAPELSQR